MVVVQLAGHELQRVRGAERGRQVEAETGGGGEALGREAAAAAAAAGAATDADAADAAQTATAFTWGY